MTNTTKKKEWICGECSELYQTKGDLIEHLEDEIDEHGRIADWCEYLLDKLNAK